MPRDPMSAGTRASPAALPAPSEQDGFASRGSTWIDQVPAAADENPLIPGSPCTMDLYCVRDRPAPARYTSIAAGSRHTCGLRADGRVRCWGEESSLYPYTGAASNLKSSNFVAIDANGSNTCGLRMDGSIYCWHEERDFPQLSPVEWRPQRPFEHGTYRAVTVGGSQVCALNVELRVECWGRFHWEEPSSAGELGELSSVRFSAIDAGASHVCGLRDDKSILCWGRDEAGQLDAPTEKSYVHLTAGRRHTCALTTGHAAVCWGDDSYGQSTPPNETGFSMLTAGELHTCGLRLDGTILCWGSNVDGQVTPPEGMVFAELSAGDHHTCGLSETGEAHCWGSNAYGQAIPPADLARITQLFARGYARLHEGPEVMCGVQDNGLTQCWGDEVAPTQLVTGGGPLAQIAVGVGYACGILLHGGQVACWRIGTSSFPSRVDAIMASTPVSLRFTELAIAHGRPCGLTVERRVACWGPDRDAQGVVLPSPPPGEHVAITSNGAQACAIDVAGSIKCWGRRLSLDRELERGGSPLRGVTLIGEHIGVAGAFNLTFTDVTLGSAALHLCALRRNQEIACWGANEFGQASPPNGVRFLSVVAGGRHSCGITTDEATRCWGADEVGQSTPPSDGTFIQLIAVHDSTCGLQTDGGVVCWGAYGLSNPTQPAPLEATLPLWHSADVRELDRFGIFDGTECTTQRFCTDMPLSRATLAVWLHRLVGAALHNEARESETPTRWERPIGPCCKSEPALARDAATLEPWDDVAADVWWAGHAQELVAAGVMQPCDAPNRLFCPGASVTHIELERALERTLHVRASSDQQAVTAVALDNSIAAVSADVFSMCVDRSAEGCRQGAPTRGQAATVLNRFRLHLRHLVRPEFRSASGSHSGGCGARADGTVECWGHDWTGVTHVPTDARVVDVHWDGTLWCGTTAGPYPICSGWDGGYGHTHVAASASLARRAETAIGLSHSCGLLADRSLECIVASSIGTRGPVHDSNVPEGEYTAVAVGGGHSCALRLDGSPLCWSSGLYGEDGPSEDKYGVRSPPQGARYSAIALGSKHACGLRDDGTAECWGYDGNGRLTPPTTAPSAETLDGSANEQTAEPTPLAFKDIAAGNSFTCGLTLDGLVACWGDLEGAQPPDDVLGQEFASITAVGTYVCVERPDGSKRCWGSGPFRRSLDVDARFIEVSANEELTCGRRIDETVQCWGGIFDAPPPGVQSGQSFTAIATASTYACGWTVEGFKECWTLDSEADVPAQAIAGDFAQLSDSSHHTCVLTSDEVVKCWGSNTHGEAEPPPENTYVQVSAGAVSDYRYGDPPRHGHTCAVRSDGALDCWGDNRLGQSNPPPGNDFVKVSASGVHACALRKNGRIECWGQRLRNGQGPSNAVRYTDVVVGADGGFWSPHEASDGTLVYPAHTCGLRVDGPIECWGSRYTPNKPYNRHEVDSRSRFTSMSSGRGHVCGVRTDGAIECWGIPGFIAY